MHIINSFLVSFFALFIAIDAIGILPIFMSVTSGMNKKQRKKVLFDSLSMAGYIAFLFMFLGGIVFWIMGISMVDFQIAGGILLLVFSIHFLFKDDNQKRKVTPETAVFPLATPLIVGPAVLTTLLILMDARGVVITLIAFVLNMSVVYFIFERSELLMKYLGANGVRAVSKIVDILLCAFGVMLIRKALQTLFF